MRVQLIDVDGHNFPNLPLMKISAWHKGKGDFVEWYDPLTAWTNPPDKVYMSKVFTFTPDYSHPVCGSEIIKGGTGYEYPSGGEPLLSEIEHIYPDYSPVSYTHLTLMAFLQEDALGVAIFASSDIKRGDVAER